MRLIALVSAGLVAVVASAQSAIHVPTDHPTIQAALDAASSGDEVVVSPGTYNENILFPPKDVHLRSSDGAELTVIDGGGIGRCVRFLSGTTNASIIEGFTMTGGVALGFGGGIACDSGAEPSILRNRIIGNHANFDGGGIFPRPENSVVIEGNIIGWNTAVGQAGGLQAPSSSSIVRNNLIVGNQATFGGGYFIRVESSVTLINNTFVGNTATFGSVASGDGGLSLVNCVVWDHVGAPFDIFGPGSVAAFFSDIEGGTGQPWFGTGCIDDDPLFVDPANDDYRLGRFSPAINAGDSTASPSITDYEGDARVLHGAVDMGFDEFSALIGSLDDLVLASGVNQLPTETPFNVAHPSDVVALHLLSPTGALNGAIPVLAAQVFGPASIPTGVSQFPGVHLDPASAFLLIDGASVTPIGPVGLGPLGISIQLVIPPSAVGLVGRFQGFAVAPVALNGIFGASPAHDISFE